MGKNLELAATASVAMAVYNGEKFLAKQIDSILEQLGNDDELIISYDDSQDRTLEIISEYEKKDSRVRIIENVHPGVVGNFNNALSACTKDVIFISDQDDVWVDGKREIMMQALKKSGVDLAIHNVVHIDANDNIISKPLFEEYGIGKGLLRNYLKPRYSGCCMAFPENTLSIVYPMPDSVINYDHWIGMACELFGDVVFVEDVLLEHRLHDSNITTSRRPLSTVVHQRLNLLVELIKRKNAIDRRSI